DALGIRREQLLPGLFNSSESRTAFARLQLELETAPHRAGGPDPDGITINELLARPDTSTNSSQTGGWLCEAGNVTQPLPTSPALSRSRGALAAGMLSGMADVTQILSAIEAGDPHAATDLLPLVYDELRKLAAERMAGEKPGHTLQATALVHEAYLRLVDVERAQHWNSRGHFFAAAAEAM